MQGTSLLFNETLTGCPMTNRQAKQYKKQSKTHPVFHTNNHRSSEASNHFGTLLHAKARFKRKQQHILFDWHYQALQALWSTGFFLSLDTRTCPALSHWPVKGGITRPCKMSEMLSLRTSCSSPGNKQSSSMPLLAKKHSLLPTAQFAHTVIQASAAWNSSSGISRGDSTP